MILLGWVGFGQVGWGGNRRFHEERIRCAMRNAPRVHPSIIRCGTPRLLKVTKRIAYTQVVELEFDGDATVPVWVPNILTKGSAASSFDDYTSNSQCKEEQVDMKIFSL